MAGAALLLGAPGGAILSHAQGNSPDLGGAGPAGGGFRLEGKPAVDDVFGDASDYRRTIDRFLDLVQHMQSVRDDFARAVQQVLAELQKKPEGKAARACPSDVASPYARAHHLGQEYLRAGRELTRHYEQVKEFDRLGESLGLTPDYRWKVRRVLVQYGALLTDYREMKVAFHDQLNDELKYAGCDLQQLLVKGDPQAGQTKGAAPDEPWPQPGTPGAPGVPPATTVAAREAPREQPPANLVPERVPDRTPISVAAPNGNGTGAPKRDERSGVLFYVDNTKCARASWVFVDGKKVGEVAASARVGFQVAPGPHDLCLVEPRGKQCGQPGTVRRAYLSEGWTISLRCE